MSYEPKTFKYKVSRLTKPWAIKGCESAIRALAGSAIKPEDKVIIEINNEPKKLRSGKNEKKNIRTRKMDDSKDVP